MSDIPTDLFREVLKHVPVESLFRCRSVCKTWRNIIDNPNFPKSHLNRGLSDENWLIITNDTNRKVFLLSLNQMLVEKSRIECVQAAITYFHKMSYFQEYFPVQCGLMLICFNCIKGVINWCLWNPFTGESLEIPRCDGTSEINCERINGFGYDKANDDYKLVNFYAPYTYVYSSRKNSWRKIDYIPDCDLSMEIGVFFNGAFYWVGVNSSVEQDGENVGWIITLDLSNWTYHKVPFPSGINEDNKFGLRLHVVGECLFMSYINTIHYVLWMFKGENTWIEVVSLEGDDYDRNLYPIAYLERENQIVFRFSENMFLWYNLKEKSSKQVLLHFPEDVSDQTDKGIEICYSYQVSPASLVRLNRTGGVNEGVSSEGMSGRKRKRASLRLKLSTLHILAI